MLESLGDKTLDLLLKICLDSPESVSHYFYVPSVIFPEALPLGREHWLGLPRPGGHPWPRNESQTVECLVTGS